MKTKKVNLYIINTNYPYGKTETFLENEVKFLAGYFEKVYLFPLNYPSKDFSIREVPDNVTYFDTSLAKQNGQRIRDFVFKYSPIYPHLKDLPKLFSSKGGSYRNKLKGWFLSLLVNRAFYNSEHFRYIKNHIKPDDILYFYWGGPKTIYAPEFNHKNTFIRLHGREVDMERNKNYIPLFDQIYSRSITYISISDKVKATLLSYYPDLQVRVNRLGTYDYGLGPSINGQDQIRIVSCSNVIPLKRVHLIAEALSSVEIKSKIEWVHFGDGPLMTEVRQRCEAFPGNISVIFKGRVPNAEVLSFYKNNFVHLFINVSTTEGVPVSIMEAMSFGIPCFATNVGATSEILNNYNGFLVDKDFDITQLVSTIQALGTGKFTEKRTAARQTWQEMCDANINYKKLTDLFLKNNESS